MKKKMRDFKLKKLLIIKNLFKINMLIIDSFWKRKNYFSHCIFSLSKKLKETNNFRPMKKWDNYSEPPEINLMS